MKILVVDDDTAVATIIRHSTRSKGWSVELTDNGATAVQLAGTGKYPLVLLSTELDGGEGLRVLASVLTIRPSQKVIALSGRGQHDRGVLALQRGACDYIAKPVVPGDLLARIQTRLLESCPDDSRRYLHRPGLTIDLVRRRVATASGEYQLSQRELVLLTYLMSDPGRVVRRSELLAAVWGDSPDTRSNVVDVCVRRLRSKVGPDLIETVRNHGYALRDA